MSRSTASQRGSALIFAMGFVIVVLVIAAGVHHLVLSQLQASGTQRRRVTAEYLAQAGVARTLAWFNLQGYQLPQAANLTATVPVKLASNNTAVVLPSNHPSTYIDAFGQSKTNVVSSYNTYLTAQGTSAGSFSVVASLIASQPETWELIATGQQGAVQRQVGAVIFRPQNSLFTNALFGRDFVAFNGNAKTDSYDSSIGAYGGTNVSKGGNVLSNGNITLNGNSTVNGDAIPGPDMAVTKNGNASVSGSTTPATTATTLQPVTVPGGVTNLGAIDIGGNSTRTLNAGTYVASSISIRGNADLVIDSTNGPVVLYVTGAINANGNGISNGSGKPQNLSIFATGSDGVWLGGNTAFFGTVYAPNATLTVHGNSDLYGSFVGASVVLNGNGDVHYDQFLRTLPGTPGPLKLIAEWMLPS